ncbi:M56 family metallopeptidase [Microterricola viridarii]|uniref:Peptidase family M48 n=1 Tax=Microterricola viridarii TaxID=412690 RepID=A0A1H1VUC3_9MICO|nr:M56 family metallopeptidase [Microterricola viridarii]SDS88362.1 Peptidase family M48 [Microterricola viridarii]
MLIASLALAALAVLLAWPVPLALASARWPSRAPGIALALWQAIALGGGLAMIGALLSFGLAPLQGDLGGIRALLASLRIGPIPAEFGVLNIVALGGAVLLGLHLLLNLISTAVQTERSRRRHRAAVELLSSPLPEQPGTRVLDHPTPIAYCVPGVHTVTVLSGGLIELLEPAELDAVLAHERTHLRQFHHLVLLAFRAWHAALPWFPMANRAENAVGLLVEMLADDDARHEADPHTLARAIALVGTSQPSASGELRARAEPVPAPALPTDAARTPLGQRVTRLLQPEPPLPPLARLLALTAAALTVSMPSAVLLGVALGVGPALA